MSGTSSVLWPGPGVLQHRPGRSLVRLQRTPLLISRQDAAYIPGVDLLGRKEAAQLLGISTQRLAQILESHADFPNPVAELSAGKIWLRGDVEAWAAKNGRAVAPPPVTEP